MATERAAGRADRTSEPEDGKGRRNRGRELARIINRERYRSDPGYREKVKERNRERNRERYRSDPGTGRRSRRGPGNGPSRRGRPWACRLPQSPPHA